MILYLAIFYAILTVLAYACIAVGARSDALDHTLDEHAEVRRAINFGATVFHDGAISAKGPVDHV